MVEHLEKVVMADRYPDRDRVALFAVRIFQDPFFRYDELAGSHFG